MSWILLIYLLYCSISSFHFLWQTKDIKVNAFQAIIYGIFAPFVLPFKLLFLIPEIFGVRFHVVIILLNSDTEGKE